MKYVLMGVFLFLLSGCNRFGKPQPAEPVQPADLSKLSEVEVPKSKYPEPAFAEPKPAPVIVPRPKPKIASLFYSCVNLNEGIRRCENDIEVCHFLMMTTKDGYRRIARGVSCEGKQR